jgi:hypothetical protein
MTYAAQLAGEAADAGLAVCLLRDGETAVIRLTSRDKPAICTGTFVKTDKREGPYGSPSLDDFMARGGT